jgi:hypothetical protein
LATCRFCESPIVWREVNGRWTPFDSKGSTHHCEKMVSVKVPTVDPQNATCARCWKPIVWTRNEICSCLNPIYVDKRMAGALKSKFLSSERENEKLARERARRVFRCIICDAVAISAGESVICTTDSSHIFPIEYYATEIIPS